MGRLSKSKITFLTIAVMVSASFILFLIGAVLSGWDMAKFLIEPSTIFGYIMLGMGLLAFLYIWIVDKIDYRR